MRPGIELAAVAFTIAFPLTLLLRLPTKVGRPPANSRVPRIGGFSIVTACVLAPPLVALFSEQAEQVLRDDWGDLVILAACASVVFLIGAIDDFRDLAWYTKMGAQVLASIGLYIGGYHVGEMTLPGGSSVELGVLDPVLTVLWLVFMTNALNLLDGQDGVAAGVTAMVAVTMAYAAWDLNHKLISFLFATLAGASLGFVPWNLPPARRFLGDSGAYFLGFTLAGLSIAGFVDSTGRVPLYIPVVALGLPVLDTGVAFLRRVLDGRHPMAYDNDHYYNRLERLGLGPRQIALASYGITLAFCAAALVLQRWYKDMGSAVVGGFVLVFAVALIAVLGYLGTMWDSVRHGGARRKGKAPAGTVRETP
ncbi:MAG: MraY family glycosyltransferase [Hyphomicrobiales bacterium]